MLNQSCSQAESSSKMMPVTAWGQDLLLGNLIKPGNVISGCWYTVTFCDESDAVYVFDAQAAADIIRSNFVFGLERDQGKDIAQIKELIEDCFKTYELFRSWVMDNFYTLPN
jgi:hypothetical protein